MKKYIIFNNSHNFSRPFYVFLGIEAPCIDVRLCVNCSICIKERNTASESTKTKMAVVYRAGPFYIYLYYIFCTYGKSIASEFYYLNKAKNRENFFISLTYINKLSGDPFLRYGANHLFVQKSFYFLFYDILKATISRLQKIYLKK